MRAGGIDSAPGLATLVASMSQDRSPSPKDDDRNLVVVDEDFANADAEDRLWLLWERHRERIIGTFASVVIGLLAWFAYAAWADARREGIREAYAAAGADEAALRAFAAGHRGHPLATAALLQLADRAQRDGKGTVGAYDEAAANEPGSTRAAQALRWRARLYAGLLALDQGAPDATARLTAVAEATEAPEALRGPAFLALARASLAAKDAAGARAWLDKMDRLLGPNHPWREDQRRLIAGEPALRPSAPKAP
jgi:hypothetical protein